jgi:hypothetical protein
MLVNRAESHTSGARFVGRLLSSKRLFLLTLPFSISSKNYFAGDAVQGIETSLVKIVPKTEKPFGNLNIPWLDTAESKMPSNENIPMPVSSS